MEIEQRTQEWFEWGESKVMIAAPNQRMEPTRLRRGCGYGDCRPC
jgi:hypothetical protein